MALDLSLLTLSHGWLFLASFSATVVLLLIAWWFSPQFLRRRRNHDRLIMYGGVVIAVVLMAGTSIVITDTGLKWGVIAATAVLVVGGIIDERLSLPPLGQFVLQLTAILITVSSGWTIPHITNPWGEGVIDLTTLQWGWLPIGTILTVGWLLLLFNGINWFDGSDGLAGSVSLIAFGTLASISLLPQTHDAVTVALAIIGMGTSSGFLVWNWYPARMYLGTVGSWTIALYLGLTALVGGGKIATTMLVLAVPLLDALLVIIQRLWSKQAPWRGDTARHLHFQLKDRGFTPPQIAIMAIVTTLLLALATVSLQTRHKLWLLLGVAGILSGIIGLLRLVSRHIVR